MRKHQFVPAVSGLEAKLLQATLTPYSSSLSVGYASLNPTYDTGKVEPDGKTPVPGFNVAVGQAIDLEIDVSGGQFEKVDWFLNDALDGDSSALNFVEHTPPVNTEYVQFYAGIVPGKVTETADVDLVNASSQRITFELNVLAPSGSLTMQAGSPFRVNYLDANGTNHFGVAQTTPETFSASVSNTTNTFGTFGIVQLLKVEQLRYTYSDGTVIYKPSSGDYMLDASTLWYQNYARVVRPESSRLLFDGSDPSMWGESGDATEGLKTSPYSSAVFQFPKYRKSLIYLKAIDIVYDYQDSLTFQASMAGGLPIAISSVNWSVTIHVTPNNFGYGTARNPANWVGTLVGPQDMVGDDTLRTLSWTGDTLDYIAKPLSIIPGKGY